MRAANVVNDRDCKEAALQTVASRPEFRKLARAVSSASKAWIHPVPPLTAMSRIPPVHRTNRERALGVELGRLMQRLMGRRMSDLNP